MPNRTITEVAPVGELPEATRYGYHFQGWVTAWGMQITRETILTTDAICYAQWTPIVQTVTFAGEGGFPETQTMTYSYGEKYNPLPSVQKAGYVFDGWFSAAEGGEPVTAETPVTGDETRTLYGQWTAGKQTVTFAPCGGECAVESLEYTVDGLYGDLPEANRAGYVFAGWFTAAEGGEPVTAESTVTVDDTRTLYAQWTAGKQTVTFVPCGGECAVESLEYTVDGLYGDLPEANRAGYVFAGWFTAAEGGEPVTAESTVTVDDTRTLYAQWTETPLAELSFFSPDGWPASAFLAATPGGTNAATCFVLGNPVYLHFSYANSGKAAAGEHLAKVAVLDAFDNEISYWYWLREELAPNDHFSVTNDNIRVDTETNVTLTVAGNYKVTVVLDAEGDVEESDESNNAITLDFTVVNPSQRVTFDPSGGICVTETESYTIGATYTNLPTATRTGYMFAGWWTSANGGTQITANSTVSTDSTRILYAHWTAWTQAVTFDANGGTPETQTQTYTIGSTYDSFPVVTRPGYEFDGWWTDATNGTQVMASTVVTVDETLRLYAHWNPESDETTVRFAFGTDGGTQTLVLAGGNSTSQSNPLGWVESSLQVALAGGSRTTTLTVTCAANSGAKRMGTLAVTVDRTVYTVEVVQDGGFGVAECAMDSDSGLFQVKWVGDTGKTYTLQRAQSLDGPWTAAGSVAASADGIVSLDAAMPGKWTSGFYRLATAE